jgi:hypothetical protein
MTNDNGINNSVTSQEILSAVKFELGIFNTNDHDAYILQAINNRLRDMTNLLTVVPLVAQLQIDLVTFTAKLPVNFMWLNGVNPIRTFTDLPTNTPSVTVSPAYVGDGFYKGSLSTPLGAQIPPPYNHVYFGSDTTDTMCMIAFMGTNIDANGSLVLPRIADNYLTKGACADWCRSRGDASQKALFQSYDLEAKKAKAKVRGFAAHSDPQDQKRLAEINNKFAIDLDNFRFY